MRFSLVFAFTVVVTESTLDADAIEGEAVIWNLLLSLLWSPFLWMKDKDEDEVAVVVVVVAVVVWNWTLLRVRAYGLRITTLLLAVVLLAVVVDDVVDALLDNERSAVPVAVTAIEPGRGPRNSAPLMPAVVVPLFVGGWIAIAPLLLSFFLPLLLSLWWFSIVSTVLFRCFLPTRKQNRTEQTRSKTRGIVIRCCVVL